MFSLERRQYNLFDRSGKVLLYHRHLWQVPDLIAVKTATEFNASRLGRKKAGNSLQERGLAGAVMAYNTKVIAFVYIVIQIPDQILATIT